MARHAVGAVVILPWHDGCLTETGLALTSHHPKPIRKGQ